ncbi:acyl-CoA Delta-9 desaturase-like [Ischnura elegans]|uniref:acyl-CoA Delta-9 desaturase-like n=1 Tax=Ischnura elegans TaxID=197161 RepID=UPI001ED8B066|nr:acyl-CoA Delta-9 desaturase-like [Ischnura elegans]
MAPNLTSPAAYRPDEPSVLPSSVEGEKASAETNSSSSSIGSNRQVHIVWRNVLVFTYLHLGALYGIYLTFTAAKLYTFLWSLLITIASALGITAGAHRLWAHKAYKAKWQLRLILAVFQTIAFQNHIYEWVRDHRVHHKFSESDADPHNANRGFFFSHIGWLLCKKHPDVIRKGKTVDMSDLEEDFIVVWQRRTYLLVMPILCLILPTWIPCHFWGEDPWTSWYVCYVMRYTLSLNGTWLVNSAAHIWGTKPFDKNISPTENIPVAIAAFGEGWHNYHHVFPWDYKAAELGNYRTNLTTAFIDFFAWVGWAYDLKKVPVEMVRKRAARTGDGSYQVMHDKDSTLWGWGDKDMADDDVKDVEQFSKSN